jgi:prepilin-type N-terminal cleavage/methylation domain-containing protein
VTFLRRSAKFANRGFTLIEIMVVLGILVLLAGMGMKGKSMYDDSRRLQMLSDELKFMAKKGWQRSVSKQQDWQIVIQQSQFELLPKKDVSEESQKMQDEIDRNMGAKAPERETIPLGQGVRVKVMHFGAAKWQESPIDRWVFKSSGLCEPIKLRIERLRENGNAESVELEFDPLTAAATRVEFSE